MEKVQSADGTQIAFDRTGQGPALVLVVGAFSDRSSTKALASKLSSRFTVYEYDRRGRGDSGEAGPYSVEREVEDLAAVVKASGGSAFAFGHSSGGALALEAAASGAPIRSIVVHEPPFTDGATTEFADRLEKLEKEGRNGEVAEAFILLTGAPAAVVQQMKSAPYWPHMESFAHTLPYEIRLCNEGKVPIDRLEEISVPVLATAGGSSAAWAREVAQSIAAAAPRGQARVLEGQSHEVSDEVLVPLLTELFL
jgi:pimeloyl-ACP methyl ester carboxylesterase